MLKMNFDLCGGLTMVELIDQYGLFEKGEVNASVVPAAVSSLLILFFLNLESAVPPGRKEIAKTTC